GRASGTAAPVPPGFGPERRRPARPRPCPRRGRFPFVLAHGEGSGLTLAGPEGRVELATEPLVLGFEVADASPVGVGAGTGDGLHTPILGVAQPAAAPPRPRSRAQFELGPLDNYPATGSGVVCEFLENARRSLREFTATHGATAWRHPHRP